MARARLRKRLERVIRDGHPWIWRKALDGLEGVAPGEVVTVTNRRDRVICRGLADEGPIGVRVWAVGDRRIDASLFAQRARQAASLRDRVVPPDTDCYRLVHGEGDRMPGVVCDVYGEQAVLRFDGSGASAWKDTVVAALEDVLRERGVTSLLTRSGRQDQRRVSAIFGRVPDGTVDVREHGMWLRADLAQGQKSGLFLDHRESRRRVRDLARGARVLNLYGYTGGFSVAAGLGGAARAETVDVAPGAIELATRSWELNGLPADGHAGHVEDVHRFLERARADGRRWDLIVSDPPSFAPRESAVEKALDAYRKLHEACVDLLEPGGLLLAASCSSHVRRESFDQTVFEGARRARRVLQVLERSGAPADHPRLAAFPEGDYLKVVLVREAT